MLQTIELDRGCFACALGGPDGRTLFMVAAEWNGPASMIDGPGPAVCSRRLRRRRARVGRRRSIRRSGPICSKPESARRPPRRALAILGGEMPEQSLEIVRRIHRPHAAPRPRSTLRRSPKLATPDTEFDFTDAYPDGPVVRGIDGVRRDRCELAWWDASALRPGTLPRRRWRAGARLRARQPQRGSGAGSRWSAAPPTKCTFSSGRLVRFKVYSDQDDALAAARPPE